MNTLLKQLTSIAAPVGHESEIRNFIKNEIKDYADSITEDPMGNLIVTIGEKKKNGKSILVSAHMDEIGLIVTHVDKQGFARFSNLGAVFPRNTVAGRVKFLNGVAGVINNELALNATKVPPLSKHYIDFGAKSDKDCPVKVGDVGVFDRAYQDLGNVVVSKALDDRAGVYVLIETIKRFKGGTNQLIALFSVQEEFKMVGATTAAYHIEPDIGIAVDVTLTGDTPNSRTMEVALGDGPAIKLMDSGTISDPKIVRWMETTAKKNKIPYQLEILTGGATDAMGIQKARGGVPIGCISIACRYVHSPSEMVNKSDLAYSIDLLHHLLSSKISF